MEIKLSEIAVNNLTEFLNRTSLKGIEVPAFIEVINAIKEAQMQEIEQKSKPQVEN